MLAFFSLAFLRLCGQPINKLTNSDFEWMPYSGHETLVFKSNKGETDTIFLLKKDTILAYPEAQSINGRRYEVLLVFCRHSDPSMSNDKHRYIENSFMELNKTIDNQTEIVINLSAKDAKFYRLSRIRIDSLNKEKQISFRTALKEYKDVYLINAEDYLGSFRQRSNFISKIYWSKSQGLVGYDKTGDVHWELEKK